MRREVALGSFFVAVAAVGALAAQLPQYVERVEVARVLIDARVVDGAGRPVLGLQPSDFDLRIDDKSVRVESVQWIGGEPASVPIASTPIAGAIEPTVRGRLIVLLVQKSFELHRIMGLLHMMQKGGGLLARLKSDDRVAVLSFDSHLRVWLDFTGDLDHVRAVLAEDVMFRQPGLVEPAPEPSLVARLTQDRGRRTYTMEEALRLIANALEPLPGSKSVVLVGYGFGRLTSMVPGFGAALDDGYEEARTALQAARASVFSLDVTNADFHTLEFGLQTVSEDTGGFFARAYRFPQQAIDRVAGALEGHYVLIAEKPELDPGTYCVAVRLVGQKGRVLARSTYTD